MVDEQPHPVKTVYLSQYTYQELELSPQILMAQMNIVFGTVAIILAIGTGGGSLYVLAIADGVLGGAMVTVNAMKAHALSHGNVDTPLLDLEQKILDDIGITLAVVNLALLLKHCVYTVANKMANGRNIVAVDDAWTAFKLDNVTPPKPMEPPELPKTKTKTKEPSKGGPGVNQPIDEFDDAVIYQGAGKGRQEPPSATGGKVEGTGKGNYLTNPEEMRPYIVPPKDGFDALVERKYIEIRKVGLEDVSTVAKNTGLTEAQVTKMKEHLFLTIHNLSVEGQPYKKLYFQADADVAYAWQLAQKRELTDIEKDWFKRLANHEIKEQEIMKYGYIDGKGNKIGPLPLRDPTTWDIENRYKPDPTKNAHDAANALGAKQPSEDFPGYDKFSEYLKSTDEVIEY
ncbi:hypothetical protein [Paenibacillus algorifonticola]|nr:hypothetical protein [Paenibacillus algorifonticola]